MNYTFYMAVLNMWGKYLCVSLNREVPRLKQRFAGKSIPIEKFAVKKAKRFTEQGSKLTLPALVCILYLLKFM